MKFAITPCPNDTFSYCALIDGRIENPFDFVFDDIEGLNLCAESGKYEITKMSFAAYLKNRDKYELLDAGAALGMGTGPVLVSRPGSPDFDGKSKVAVPGLNTTAALLLRFYAGKDVPMEPIMFRGIADAINRGEFDYGVLIHEGRFVIRESGLKLVEDLGGYWTAKTGLPVPLGCICVRRDVSECSRKIDDLIRASIAAAFADPKSVYPFVRDHAQYLQEDVLMKHIYAFVNGYSKSIAEIKDKLLENLEKC